MSQFYSNLRERERQGFDSPFLGESTTAQSFRKEIEQNMHTAGDSQSMKVVPTIEEPSGKESSGTGTETPIALISKSSYDNLHTSDRGRRLERIQSKRTSYIRRSSAMEEAFNDLFFEQLSPHISEHH